MKIKAFIAFACCKIVGSADCSFGMGADIDGVFMKTGEVAKLGQVVR